MSPIFNTYSGVENFYNMYGDKATCFLRKDPDTLLIAKNKKQAYRLMKKLGW